MAQYKAHEEEFFPLFKAPESLSAGNINLFGSLNDTRHALQESLSENQNLEGLINNLYDIIVEEVNDLDELLREMPSPPFKCIPLPENWEDIPVNHQAGYVAYGLRFLGHATRKISEYYAESKANVVQLQKSIKENTVDLKIKRSGQIVKPALAAKNAETVNGNKPQIPVKSPTTPGGSKPKQNVKK